MLSKEITSKVVVMAVKVAHQKEVKRTVAVQDIEADHVLDPTAQISVIETTQKVETTTTSDLASGK